MSLTLSPRDHLEPGHPLCTTQTLLLGREEERPAAPPETGGGWPDANVLLLIGTLSRVCPLLPLPPQEGSPGRTACLQMAGHAPLRHVLDAVSRLWQEIRTVQTHVCPEPFYV